VVWSYLTGDTVESSAALFNDTVYFGSSDASVCVWPSPFVRFVCVVYPGAVVSTLLSAVAHSYALDQATGALKWQFTTGDEVDGAVVVDPARARVIAVSNDNK
jgi:outer membrane protein assembly factor BamB